jgi:hypothetical protein
MSGALVELLGPMLGCPTDDGVVDSIDLAVGGQVVLEGAIC